MQRYREILYYFNYLPINAHKNAKKSDEIGLFGQIVPKEHEIDTIKQLVGADSNRSLRFTFVTPGNINKIEALM